MTLGCSEIGRSASRIAGEYSQSVRLNSGIDHPLPINTGSGTFLNLYWIEEGGKTFLRMEDDQGGYLLDMQTDRLYMDREFAGEPKTEHPRVMRQAKRGLA